MDDIQKRIIRNLARTVYRLTGNPKSYKRIRRVFRKSKKFNSNCHGFTLYLLGIDISENPRYIDYRDMEAFLIESCFKSRKENGIITIFRNGDEELEHSGIMMPAGEDYFITHQRDTGLPYEMITFENFYNKNPTMKHEMNEEYYKFFPNYLSIPSFLNTSHNT